MSALTDGIKKLQEGEKLISRLEKIVSKLSDAFECESLIELVEAEVRMELPGAERDRIFLSGSGNADIRWEFKDIIDGWIQVYSEDTDECNDALRGIGDQFCKLGRMFHEAADPPAEE